MGTLKTHICFLLACCSLCLNFYIILTLCLGGLETESQYPYEAADEKCKFRKSEAVVYVNGSVAISKDENGEACLHYFC